MTDGPKRYESDEYTLKLPLPPSQPRITTPPPELQQALHEALEGPHEEETQVPCPACAECAMCRGTHLVSPAVFAEYRRVFGTSNPPKDPTT